MYREYLVFSGFEVEIAVNGLEAIDKVRSLRPDLVLMDLSLPLLDGWEATRRLKEDADTAAIPVVALSAHAMAAEAARARAVGCDGFIAKPCLPETLVTELARHLPAAPARRLNSAGASRE